jgi:hypothetical protein
VGATFQPVSDNSDTARLEGHLARLSAASRSDEQFKISREHVNEVSGLEKSGEICDLMSYYQLMKKCSVDYC